MLCYLYLYDEPGPIYAVTLFSNRDASVTACHVQRAFSSATTIMTDFSMSSPYASSDMLDQYALHNSPNASSNTLFPHPNANLNTSAGLNMNTMISTNFWQQQYQEQHAKLAAVELENKSIKCVLYPFFPRPC